LIKFCKELRDFFKLEPVYLSNFHPKILGIFVNFWVVMFKKNSDKLDKK
jgi:hypothetical protein